VYRNPRLAELSLEELQTLDDITKKLVVPSQDGPHDQIESNTAIEAERVSRGATVRRNPLVRLLRVCSVNDGGAFVAGHQLPDIF
jgi:hypothetical protein